MLKIIPFIHKIIKDKVSNEDITIDATVGNGNDTLFLCKISKFVYGFDIQGEAIKNTEKKLTNFNNYSLFLSSHENVLEYVKEDVKAVIFNLGYLPNGDKEITTLYPKTIIAIKRCISLLAPGGIICITLYPGHENGRLESINIEAYANSLDQRKFNVLKYIFTNQINNPPYALIIEKID